MKGKIIFLTALVLILTAWIHASRCSADYWVTEIVEDENTFGQHCSLALDSFDRPHCCYSFGYPSLRYARFNGDEWVKESADDVSSYCTSIVLDIYDNPHISYYYGSEKDLKYAHYNGSTWQVETVDAPGYVGQNTSIALDGYGRPHISYYAHDDPGNPYPHLKYAHYTGSSWQVETIEDPAEYNYGSWTAINVDSQNRPHIIYSEFRYGAIKYAYYNGSSWQLQQVDTAGSDAGYISMELDEYDHPHVSYKWDSNTLKYAYYNGSAWQKFTIETEGPGYSSLVIDESNRPLISYQHNGCLKTAYYTGSSWQKETVDCDGNVGKYCSLALDSEGKPHICYYDDTNKNLKYARKVSGEPTATPEPTSTLVPLPTITPTSQSSGVPPAIQHTTATFIQPAVTACDITAIITDVDGDLDTNALFVYSSTDEGFNWTNALMEWTGYPDEFAVSIPEQELGTVVWYYISASDLQNPPNTSFDPEFAPSSHHEYAVGWLEPVLITSDDPIVDPIDLEWGVHPEGSEDYDSGLDMPLPPPGMNPPLDAFFDCDDPAFNRLRRDIKNIPDWDLVTSWLLGVDSDDGFTLEWNVSDIPALTQDGRLIQIMLDTGTEVIDMRARNSEIFSSGYYEMYIDVYSELTTPTPGPTNTPITPTNSPPPTNTQTPEPTAAETPVETPTPTITPETTAPPTATPLRLYQFLCEFGSLGSGPCEFGSDLGPRGIALDDYGYVYVADYGNQKLKKWDIDCNCVPEWIVNSGYGAQLEYYADHLYQLVPPGGIKKWTLDGQLVWSVPVSIPYWSAGMTMDSDHNLQISIAVDRKVVVYNTEGQFVREYIVTDTGQAGGDIHASPDGYIYLSVGGDEFAKFTNAGVDTGWRRPAYGESLLFIDDEGNFWTRTEYKARKYDSAWNLVTEIGYDYQGSDPEEFYWRPSEMAEAPDGRVFLSDGGNGGNYRVQAFVPYLPTQTPQLPTCTPVSTGTPAMMSCDWEEQFPSTSPDARHEIKIVYDDYRGVCVLFGGGYEGGTQSYADTWEYNVSTGTWTEKNTSASPSARIAYGMAYDSTRDVAVFFGGSTNGYGGYYNDTWEYDGTNWTQISPDTNPYPRRHHRMVYDSCRGVVVMFGGWNGGGYNNETWEWDGSDWTLITTVGSPGPRAEPMMAFDEERCVTALFGGSNGGVYLDDTWEYDGSDWQQKYPTGSVPPARNDGRMIYDSNRNLCVLFGGTTDNGPSNDTWTWDGNTWVEEEPATIPPIRTDLGLAYDSCNEIMMMFGGQNSVSDIGDTWEYNCEAPTPTPAPTNTPTLIPTETAIPTPFLCDFQKYDDFTDGDWTSNPSWECIQGCSYWSASSGALRYNGPTPNPGAGILQIPQTAAYGCWKWRTKVEGDGHYSFRHVHFIHLDSDNFYELVHGEPCGHQDCCRTWFLRKKVGGETVELDSYYTGEGFDLGTWRHCRIERTFDGSFFVYIDDVLCMSATDNEFTTSNYFRLEFQDHIGGWQEKWIDDIYGPAEASPTPTYVPTVIPTPTGVPTPFPCDFQKYDDFSDGDWTSNPSWGCIQGCSYWSAASGALRYNGPAPNPGAGILQIPQTAAYGCWKWRTKVEGDGHYSFRHVHFIHLDSDNFYELVHGEPCGHQDCCRTWFLRKKVGGETVELDSYYTGEGFDLGTWRHCRIERTFDGSFFVYIDDVLCMSATDNEFTTSNYFRLEFQDHIGGWQEKWIDDIYGPADQTIYDWHQIFPDQYPSARAENILTYDQANNEFLLFGGSVDGINSLNDTWVFDTAAENWILLDGLNESPACRLCAAAAYDASKGVTVLFGGSITGYGGYYSDTWEFDGSSWLLKQPNTSPCARRHHKMVYDPNTETVILFGGWNGGSALNDTWQWDGTNWSLIDTEDSPSPRTEPMTAYDENRNCVVLYGGCAGSEKLDDTWELHCSYGDSNAADCNWVLRKDGSSPGPLANGAMSYDDELQKCILFGGSDQNGDFTNHTWTWDGVNAEWNQESPEHSPEVRCEIEMAYNPEMNYTLLFGGAGEGCYFDDAWKYSQDGYNPNPTPVPTFTPASVPAAKPAGLLLLITLIAFLLVKRRTESL